MSEKRELTETLQIAMLNALSNTHTNLVAKVTAVNATTINCRPVVNRVIKGQSIKLPDFIDVMPVFLQGGGDYLAHPVAVGDYCLLIVAERCIDRWYNGADFVKPPELRMHDYSDSFAIIGVNPKGSAIAIPDVTTQKGDMDIIGNVEVDGNVTANGDVITSGNTESGTYTTGGTSGVSGTFQSDDGKSITVANGLITGIV